MNVFRSSGDTAIGVARSTEPYAADLTDSGQEEEAFRRILADHGRIDVLAHIAGAFAAEGAVESSSAGLWTRMMAINFDAALHAIRAALPAMKARRGGRIVAVGSRAGLELAAGAGAYSVSKAALHALVRTVALECVEQGITCNAVLPGTIDTEANRSWGTPEQIATWVKPESIAAAIAWLASDAAADINGALVPVYGRS
jgi:NAD(P)-dependent dehydrogenase (short-subunit alcohol dehydrogenase family)